MAHDQCDNGEWEDLFSTVNAVTNRVCTLHAVCGAGTYKSAEGTSTADTVCLDVSDCDTTAEYEAVAPTPSSNRGCKEVSLACVVGTKFEASAATPTSDRVCESVDICIKHTDNTDITNYPGFYMESAPTATANTVCTALKSCVYDTEEIVHPVSTDTTTFAVDVYDVDRTCKSRQVCETGFETTEKTATSTTCETVPTITYDLTFTDSCGAVEAELTSNADWETYINQNLKTDVPDIFNVGNFADDSDFDSKVMGTGSTYTEPMLTASLDASTCKTFVNIFFVPSQRKRHRRTGAVQSLANRLRRALSTPAATVYPEGTTACTSNPLETCCKAGYGADGEGACIACASMTYTDGETEVDANGGCADQPTCDFTAEFYIDKSPSTQSAATSNCQTMQSCAEQGKLSEPLVQGNDRSCSAVGIVLCDFATQYWSNSDDAHFLNTYEWSVNPTCTTSDACATDSWWTNADATVDVPAKAEGSDNLVVEQVFVDNRVCDVRSCNAEQYAANYATVALEPTNSKVNYDCVSLEKCDENNPIEYASVEGTLMNDAVCTLLSTCTLGTDWQSTAPTPTSNRYCTDVSECESNEVESVPPTTITDRKCVAAPTAAPTATPTATPTAAPTATSNATPTAATTLVEKVRVCERGLKKGRRTWTALRQAILAALNTRKRK